MAGSLSRPTLPSSSSSLLPLGAFVVQLVVKVVKVVVFRRFQSTPLRTRDDDVLGSYRAPLPKALLLRRKTHTHTHTRTQRVSSLPFRRRRRLSSSSASKTVDDDKKHLGGQRKHSSLFFCLIYLRTHHTLNAHGTHTPHTSLFSTSSSSSSSSSSSFGTKREHALKNTHYTNNDDA